MHHWRLARRYREVDEGKTRRDRCGDHFFSLISSIERNQDKRGGGDAMHVYDYIAFISAGSAGKQPRMRAIRRFCDVQLT